MLIRNSKIGKEDTLLDEIVEFSSIVKPMDAELIIHNDDFNTIEWIINSLIEVCDHTPLQAEQCATLIHYTGKCSVKIGSLSNLKIIRQTLDERGISAQIKSLKLVN